MKTQISPHTLRSQYNMFFLELNTRGQHLPALSDKTNRQEVILTLFVSAHEQQLLLFLLFS